MHRPMDLRATLACAAGACLGIALFYGAAGGSGRLKAAPAGSAGTSVTVAAPRTVTLSDVSSPRSADSETAAAGGVIPGVEEVVTPPPPPPAALRSRIFDALGGAAGAPLGERVRLVDADADPVTVEGLSATGVCLLTNESADRDALKLAIAAVRGVAPSARLAVAGFLPGADTEPDAAERDAALLASVDFLAVAAPARADAAAAERFFDAAGRHGRRVLALIQIPDAIDRLPAWRAAFRGATAAGVHVVLTGRPGNDPDTEAAWRSEVAAHLALQQRLGDIAYD